MGLKGPDLVQGAGEAVEQPAVGGVGPVETIGDDPLGELVGDVVAGGHDGADLLAQLGALLDVRAEDVAGGDGGDAVVRGDADGLRALARARSAHDEQSHERNPS